MNSPTSFDDKFLLTEDPQEMVYIGRRSSECPRPERLDVLCIFLVKKGVLYAKIDSREHQFASRTVVHVIDLHSAGDFRVSPDFQGEQLILGKDFVQEMFTDTMHFPRLFSIRENPGLKLDARQFKVINNCFLRIKERARDPSHYFYRQLVMNDIRALSFEIAGILIQSGKERGALSGIDAVTSKFIHLLDQNIVKEHDVDFYARELCITPEYLSRLCKMMNDEPAKKWVTNELVKRAKIFLKNPTKTVQEIAYALNFADASAFSKFFRKNVGASPAEYREGAAR